MPLQFPMTNDAMQSSLVFVQSQAARINAGKRIAERKKKTATKKKARGAKRPRGDGKT